MNSGFVRIDQKMPVLLTMKNSRLQAFTQAEHNLIKPKLCKNWSGQAVSSISECDIWK